MRIHITISDPELGGVIDSIPKQYLGLFVQEAIRHYLANADSDTILNFLRRSSPDAVGAAPPKRTTAARKTTDRAKAGNGTTPPSDVPGAETGHGSAPLNERAGLADILGDFGG